jgi:hypothetical protein
MLIRNKFNGYSRDGIRLYNLSLGGSSPPPAPDYRAAAEETAAGNLKNSRYTTNANRVNQITPYGSLTYSKTAPTFNQSGYDEAMAKYNATPQTKKLPSNYGMPAYEGGDGSPVDRSFGMSPIQNDVSSNLGKAPSREDFMTDDGSGWTQTMNLTPQAQATLDKQMKLSDQYADVASAGFGNIKGLMENPNIDTSGMPQMRGIDMSQLSGIRNLNSDMSGIRGLNSDMSGVRNLDINGLPQGPINAGQTAQDALMSRINPSLTRDQEALSTRLANQGIALGSSAYNREMNLQGQNANDLRLQAAAQGISLDQAARNAAFGERQALSNFDLNRNNQQFGQNQAASLFDLNKNQQQYAQNQGLSAFDLARNNQQFGQQNTIANLSGNQRNQALQEAYAKQSRPLDLVNALRTGANVQNPTFQPYAQQQTVPGADFLGATNQQYGQQMNAYNAQQAGQDKMMGGLMNLGSSAITAGLF